MKPTGVISVLCLAFLAMTAASSQQKPYTDDLNEKYQLPAIDRDYTKREVMIPMRDGVKLFTVIWIPKGAHDAPIVLTRTPYDAAHHVGTPDANHLIDALPLAEKDFVRAGYIRIYQDVRGKGLPVLWKLRGLRRPTETGRETLLPILAQIRQMPRLYAPSLAVAILSRAQAS